MESTVAMNKRKKLPIGIQEFDILISQDYIYVDKTEYLYNLIETGRVYFISRPRRFGKSLLISTFKAIFQGKKDLFKDLWISSSDYQFEAGPVIHLDMSSFPNEDERQLKQEIIIELNNIANNYKVEIIKHTEPATVFKDLITQL